MADRGSQGEFGVMASEQRRTDEEIETAVIGVVLMTFAVGLIYAVVAFWWMVL
jgi:hypothetical protein